MGTTVDEHSAEMAEIVRRICKSSDVHDPKQVQRFILDNRRRYEADSYLGGYLTEDEIVDRLIEDMEAQNGPHAAGVVSADTVRAYKPHREIFDEALRLSGCAPGEAVHIGDSYGTDVTGARAAGVRPVLLLRGRSGHDGVENVDNLIQALNLIFNIETRRTP